MSDIAIGTLVKSRTDDRVQGYLWRWEDHLPGAEGRWGVIGETRDDTLAGVAVWTVREDLIVPVQPEAPDFEGASLMFRAVAESAAKVAEGMEEFERAWAALQSR